MCSVRMGLYAFVVVMVTVLARMCEASGNCDVIVSSQHQQQKNGTFQSPSWPDLYPNNVHCLYKFIGKDNERVKIKFTAFDVQGRPPMCDFDYVDVFAQLKSHTDNLLDSPLMGRFCGDSMDKLPELVVSTNSALVLSFYTDDTKQDKGFSGTYEFFDASMFDIGTKAPPKLCGYTIRSETKADGYILSPTYPGMYPDNQFCYYKLQGKPGQRIRLQFIDFSLFHGGEYCPFDYLRIYDGYTSDARVIGTFCGKYSNSTVVLSTSEALHIEFVTTQGRLLFGKPPLEAEADFRFGRRGFNISYEFSDKFVRLDFIKPEAEHILGTECDQRIMSRKESNGTITSPNYPDDFPQNITCRYYLDGLMDRNSLEKAKITFFDFKIPGNMPYCNIGYIALNEDARLSGDTIKEKFCGNLLPPALVSNGPRMVLTLNTHSALRGGRFLARYKFITGTPITEGACQILYDSAHMKSGYFNSPRYPGNYPVSTDCEYIFRPLSTEYVLIYFDIFALEQQDKMDRTCLRSDYLAFLESALGSNNYSVVERHCGEMYPGPYITDNQLKVIFHSNAGHSSMGFKANYRFVPKQMLEQTCGIQNILSGSSGGTIQSPDFPRKYKPDTFCEWRITASRKENRIMLQFMAFKIEGSRNLTGCQNALVRIYSDSASLVPSDTLCGAVEVGRSYMSVRNSIKVSFVSAARSIGAKGFKMSWTEIHNEDSCYGFQCKQTKYCIAEGLKCNKEPNCGPGDESDETAECPVVDMQSSNPPLGPKKAGVQILHIAIGTSISSFFCIILLICGFYHRRKFRNDRPAADHDHVEVRYVSAPTGCNTTDRLLMEEAGNSHNQTDSPRCQKVSMV